MSEENDSGSEYGALEHSDSAAGDSGLGDLR